MATTDKILLYPHTGQSPVHDASGRVIATITHDTGLKRVYYILEEDGKQISGQQVAFLHPNGFVHFIIPEPPIEFVNRVKEEIQRQSGVAVNKTGSPPKLEEDDDGE